MTDAPMSVEPGSDMPGPFDTTLVELAPAKVNLSLVVRGRRRDGYHELVSLVAFAIDVCDTVSLCPGAVGPTKVAVSDLPRSEVEGLLADNLVDRAVAAVAAVTPEARLGQFCIEKRIPLAAGLGGGSADAAAALRALAKLNGIADVDARFHELATRLGADVPVCIGDPLPRAAMMGGIGERLWRQPPGEAFLPGGLAAVLVNPRQGVPTGAVFRELAASPFEEDASAARGELARPAYPSIASLMAALAGAPNDLEAPALRIAPVIGEVLAAIAALPGCRLARMSGSGATCFGLFDDLAVARLAADALAVAQPHWWVRPSRLV